MVTKKLCIFCVYLSFHHSSGMICPILMKLGQNIQLMEQFVLPDLLNERQFMVFRKVGKEFSFYSRVSV